MMPAKTPHEYTTAQARDYCARPAALVAGLACLSGAIIFAFALWRWLPQIFGVIVACVVIRSGFVLADGLPAVLAQAAALHERTAP